MMDNLVGIKEMYDVNIRLVNPLEIEKKKFEKNESILSFKTIELAQISENKGERIAHGGFKDAPLIIWENEKAIQFGITNGVLSPKSWALLSNSTLDLFDKRSVSYNEELEVLDDNTYCYVDLKYIPNNYVLLGAQPNPRNEPLPMGRRQELKLKPLPVSNKKWLFIYDLETGEKIKDFEIYQNRIYFKQNLRRVLVDYTFDYLGEIRCINLGERLINTWVRIEGKMSSKDQKTGEVKSVIVDFPKVRIGSSLSIRLGKNYESSVVSDFYFSAFPDEENRREKQKAGEIVFLENELTGEYL